MRTKNLFLKIMLFSATFALALITACACGLNGGGDGSGKNSGKSSDEGDSADVPNTVSSITLSVTDKMLEIDESFTLIATLENISGTVTWTSSDPAVASVDQDGFVVANSEGSTTITASIEELSATCAVIVENNHDVPYCLFTADSVENLEPNQEITVQVRTILNGSTIQGLTYEWATDVNGIVELTPSSDTASVSIKGLKFGTVEVSCLTVCNGVPLYPSFKVNVFNPDVTFEVEGEEQGIDGYPVYLTLFEGAQFGNECTVSQITVKDGGHIVANSQIQWVVDDENVATYENGTIKAKKVGKTRILALYNDNGIYFDVNVVKAEFTVDEFTFIEVAEDNGFNRSESINGVVESVVYNRRDLFKEESDGKIHLDEKAVETIGLGELKEPIVVYTDTATYSYTNVEFIAMEIDNKEEFDRMDEVALSLGDGDSSYPTMDGIFYLNADIAYDGVYTPNEKNVANDYLGGFVGKFDGRGHVISGLKIVDGGYIFASVKQTATFKNVTLLNSEYDGTDMESGTGVFLAKVIDGKLENVFIHFSKVTLKNCNVMLIAQANHSGAESYQNVIVAVDNVIKAEGSSANSGLFTVGSRYWSAGYNNVIGIAPNVVGVEIYKLITCENDGNGNAVNWQTYWNDYTAMAEMNEDFVNGNWDEEFWHAIGGVVLPDNVTLASEMQTYEMGDNTDGINSWKSYKNDIEGEDKSLYKSGYTYNPDLIIDLSAYGFDSVLSAMIGGTIFSNPEYQNGFITVPKTAVSQRGDVTLVVFGTKVVNGENKALAVFQPLLLADILISDADDFEAMQWLADLYAEDDVEYFGYAMKSGGYIALTNNINYNRNYKVHERSFSWFTGSVGFKGTLDGRGYTVDGLIMVEQTHATNTYTYAGFTQGAFSSGQSWSAGSGIFASLCDGGTIKNIAFTNAEHRCGGGFITTLAWGGGNVIENVYVHLKYARGTDAEPSDRYTPAGVFSARMHGGSFTIQNCVVVIDSVESGKYYYDFGAFTSHPNDFVAVTRSNVFIISSNDRLVASVEPVGFATTLSGVTKYADVAAAISAGKIMSAGLTFPAFIQLISN